LIIFRTPPYCCPPGVGLAEGLEEAAVVGAKFVAREVVGATVTAVEVGLAAVVG